MFADSDFGVISAIYLMCQSLFVSLGLTESAAITGFARDPPGLPVRGRGLLLQHYNQEDEESIFRRLRGLEMHEHFESVGQQIKGVRDH